MNPKQFLIIGGAVLLVVGLVGFFGIIGPTSDKSIFGEIWYFDNPENWAHLILGIVALLAAFLLKDPMLQKYLVILVGALALFFGVYNLFSESFLGANLENPADTALHFLVGIWALFAGLRKASA